MWWTLACLSGCLGLAYELLFERAYSLICGDLYLTYAAIVLTFIFGGSLGNLCGYRLRRALPALEIAGGIIALIFGLFLRIGGYLTTIPTPVMIALLLLPSFIVGLHLPLYGHYFYQKAFDKLYTIYHLGATLGLLAIECLLIPHFALSTIFIICGSIQIIIGISVAYQTHTGRFQIKKIDLQIPQLVAIARQNAGILTLVFTMSLLSYYFHFFLIKILNFYEVITRPTYSFFLIVSIASVAVGSWLASRYKWQLNHIAAYFVLHAISIILLLPTISNFLVRPDWPHLNLYIFWLDIIAMSPLIWPSVFWCQALAQTPAPSKREDVYSGLFLFVSSLGNLSGFFLVAVLTGWLIHWSWILPLVAFALYLNCKKHWQTNIFLISALIAGTTIFAVSYRLDDLLATGIFSRSFLVGRVKNNYDFHEYYTTRIPYQAQTLQLSRGAIAGIFTRRGVGHSYVLDGYISHTIERGSEVAVGMLAREYFPENIPRSIVICLVSGQTPAGVALVSQEVDVAEINPAVVDFLPQLDRENNHLESNPHVHILSRDGFTHLKQTTTKYDLILNTATNIFTYGAAKLQSRQFMKLVRDHLQDNGVYLSWIDLSSVLTQEDLERILALQQEFFAHTDLRMIDYGYALLVSYNQPLARTPITTVPLDASAQKYLNDIQLTPRDLPVITYDASTSASTKPITLDYPEIELAALRNYLNTRYVREQIAQNRSIWTELDDSLKATGYTY